MKWFYSMNCFIDNGTMRENSKLSGLLGTFSYKKLAP